MVGWCEKELLKCYVCVLMLLFCETVLTVDSTTTEKGDWIIVGDNRIELHSSRHKRFVTGGDPPRFSLRNYLVSEADGTVENLVCVLPGTEIIEVAIFNAIGPPDRCFRFPCPPARAGVDFVPVDIFGVFIKPDKTFCFDITILNDNNVEGREFFLLALQDLRTSDIFDTTVVTILDDDDPSLITPALFVSEDAGNVRVCVRGGREDIPIKVEVLREASTASLTALNPDLAINYFVSGVEAILKAGAEECFDVTIVEDVFSEPIETMKYVVSQGYNASVMFSLEGTIYIVDNDPRPQFDESLVFVPEDAGSLEVCIHFDAPSSVTVTGVLFTEDVSSSGSLDYIPVSSPFNISGQSRQCHRVEILEDDLPESTENFKIHLSSNNSHLPPDTLTVWIYDNDYLEFEGNATIYNVAENETLELCVVYSGTNLTSTIRGLLYTQPVTAKSKKDFWTIFRIIQLRQTDRMCFNVRLVDDPFPEPDEEFKVFLYTFGTRSILHTDSVTVIIEDNGDQVY